MVNKPIARGRKKRNFRRARLTKLAKYTQVNRSANMPLAPRYRTRLRYADQQTPTLTQGVTYQYLYNLNSLFDPDRTGTGHQPYGRDTLATLYAKYRVWKCTWKITFIGNSTTVPYSVCVVPHNHASAISSLTLAMESPRSKFQIGTSAEPITMTGTIDLADLAGKPKAGYMADDLYAAAITADPNEIMCLHVFLYSSTGTPQILFNSQLTYYAELYDPVELSQS